jgi:hypothetical protein
MRKYDQHHWQVIKLRLLRLENQFLTEYRASLLLKETLSRQVNLLIC